MNFNGTYILPISSVKAGNWTQKNFIINFQSGANIDLYLTSGQFAGTSGIVDDFRMHPIYAKMNSYVYDKETDELLFVLDGNNLATEYRYDKAGRLCRTYKEVVDSGVNIGGFKLVKQYRYNYKNNTTILNCSCCDDEL